jgi:CO dehydrogenase/acetyl-CoA synthase beta subunit
MAGASAKGIRSYGPGKFYTLLDSFAFEMTLNGGVDEEASYGEGGGWYGLVWINDDAREQICEIAKEEKDPLTEEEQDLLDESLAVIFFERSDGIVEADWFDSKKEAEQAWAEILVDTEEEEEEEEEEDEEEEG